jgi:ABC-type Fe3+ transport system permease subunit
MSVQRMLAEPLRTPRLRLAVRFRRPANRSASIALVVVAAYVFMAVFGGLLAPFSPVDFNMAAVLKPPSWGHPFGTDGFGRDVLSRVLTGARSILVLATLATTFGVATGSALGLVSGYRGGLVDEALMRLVDILLALPGLLLALLILTSLGSSPTNLVIAIAIVFVPKSARVARSAIAPLRRLGYVEAARLRGTSWLSRAAAKCTWRARGRVLPALRLCPAADLVTWLSRLRRAAAGAGLGLDDQRSAWAGDDRAVDRAVPRARHRPHRGGSQRAGGRARRQRIEA